VGARDGSRTPAAAGFPHQEEEQLNSHGSTAPGQMGQTLLNDVLDGMNRSAMIHFEDNRDVFYLYIIVTLLTGNNIRK
jgi:hypothetical protein